MCGVTLPLRFGQSSSSSDLNDVKDLRKLIEHLVPARSDPRFKFMTTGIGPLAIRDPPRPQDFLQYLAANVLGERNILVDCRLSKGKYLAAVALYNGGDEPPSQRDVTQTVKKQEYLDRIRVTGGVQSAVYKVPSGGDSTSATSVINSTTIKSMFQRLVARFSAIYRRRAFTHLYTGTRKMTVDNFEEAQRNVRDLITEYSDIERESWPFS